jgi:hypothetical protein
MVCRHDAPCKVYVKASPAEWKSFTLNP